MTVRFSARVAQEKGTSAYVEVPPKALAQISDKRRVPVSVLVNGFSFRTTIAPMKGLLLLGFNKGNAEAAGVAAGDRIEVELELDDQPRVVQIPPELADALAANPRASAAFAGMSYSHRREWAEHVAQAKQPATRLRRAAKAVESLQS